MPPRRCRGCGGPHFCCAGTQVAKPGQPVILFVASSAFDSGTDPGESWTITARSTVSSYYTGGVLSAAVNLHYSAATAYEM